jgi:hypothetical protein
LTRAAQSDQTSQPIRAKEISNFCHELSTKKRVRSQYRKPSEETRETEPIELPPNSVEFGYPETIFE